MRSRTNLGVLLLAVGLAAGLASCSIANPTPTVAPDADHHAVLLIGDSLMGNTFAVAPAAMQKLGLDVTLYDGHINGSGLLDPVNGLAPLDYVKAQLAAHPDVDTVVIEWAGACSAACAQPGGIVYGSPQFFQDWTDTAHRIIDYLHAPSDIVAMDGRTLHVLWVTSPPMPPDPTGVNYQLKTDVATKLAYADAFDLAPAAGGTADWWQALSDTNGKYAQSLYYGGAYHEVRVDDLVHLTVDGASRTSAWLAKGLETAWNQ
jgi:hypothetical protein